MCFSAESSFALSAALLPVGAAAVAIARKSAVAWLPVAVYPLAFSAQQAIEGFVWLGLDSGDTAMVSVASRGFLFFSHLFWLVWPPFSAYWMEQSGNRKQIMLVLIVIAMLFGLSIALPSLMFADRLSVAVVQGSLDYRTVLIYEGIVERWILHLVYGFLVISALALSSERLIQYFAAFIVLSMPLTKYVFPYAFISVWCYFAAMLSSYLLVAIVLKARRPVTGNVRIA